MGTYINNQYFSDQQLQALGMQNQIPSNAYSTHQPKFTGFQNPQIMQQPLEQSNQNTLHPPCKLINILDDITMGDIPNDCKPAFFPVADGSAIYVKSWNNNGKVDTLKYVPEIMNNSSQNEQMDSVSNEEVMSKLNQIEKMIKGLHYGNAGQKGKKGDQDESN